MSSGKDTAATTRTMIAVVVRDESTGANPAIVATLMRMPNGPSNAHIRRLRMRSTRPLDPIGPLAEGVVIVVPRFCPG